MQQLWWRLEKKTMLKEPLCHWSNMILIGFIKIGLQMAVIYGKKFIVMTSFGTECHLIIHWWLLKNSSQTLETLHKLLNVLQLNQLFVRHLINTGMETIWLSLPTDKKTQPLFMHFLHLMMLTRLQTKKLLKPSMF